MNELMEIGKKNTGNCVLVFQICQTPGFQCTQYFLPGLVFLGGWC